MAAVVGRVFRTRRQSPAGRCHPDRNAGHVRTTLSEVHMSRARTDVAYPLAASGANPVRSSPGTSKRRARRDSCVRSSSIYGLPKVFFHLGIDNSTGRIYRRLPRPRDTFVIRRRSSSLGNHQQLRLLSAFRSPEKSLEEKRLFPSVPVATLCSLFLPRLRTPLSKDTSSRR